MGRQIGDRFIVEIKDLGDEGAGIGKSEGFTWFVKDAIPGDVVEAQVTGLKKNYGFADTLCFLTESPDRIEPFCPYFSHCGGCQLQAMSYKSQLKFKQEMVKDQLKRIGGIDDANDLVRPVAGMDNPWRYRDNEQFFPGIAENGKAAFGFYAGHTHKMVKQDDCLVGVEENGTILRTILEYMEKYDIRPYDESDGSGCLGRVQIRKGFATGDIMVCLKIMGGTSGLKNVDELISDLCSAFPETDDGTHITSICCQLQGDENSGRAGGRIIDLYGQGFITDKISTLTLQISPLSFYQINPTQTEKLYKTVRSFAELTGKETVWDLYCGIGSISLFLAGEAEKVYGVEIVPQAVESARVNASSNGIGNTEFFCGRAEEVLPDKFEKDHIRADVIVLDPPRKGCARSCLDTMIKMRPSRIVYVSCDGATMSRDIKILTEGGYSLRAVQPVDMFPQTIHIENVALLI